MNKFAIIGLGFVSSRHKKAIEDLGYEVSLTCDHDCSKKPDFTDWLEMFNHPRFKEIDSVVICTPNYLHAPMIREALFRGKKVLCEKPLSINGIEGLEGVKTVLQLRYHPEVLKLNKPKDLHIEAKMFRDDVYFDSWKGNKVKSGGILYNLGVHYIDLAIFLLGDSWKITKVEKGDRKIVADVEFGESKVHFHIEIVNSKDKQGRKMIADSKEIVLSNKENLSYEDLHKEVYKEFISGRGIDAKEAGKSLKLIDEILNYAKSV